MRRLRFFATVLPLFLLCASLLAACGKDNGALQNNNSNNTGGAVSACDTHTPGDWVTVTKPGESSEGLRKRLCTVCGETLESEVIPATGSTGLVFLAINENEYGVRADAAAADAERLVIPATYQGKPVTQILEQGFGTSDSSAKSACLKLRSVVIPDSITRIGAYAFAGCTALESITLPPSVATLEQSAFRGCTALSKITFAERGLLHVEHAAFYGCSSLVSVALPEGLRSLGSAVFSYCTDLTALTLPSSLTACHADSLVYKCEKLQFYTHNGAKYLGNPQNNYLLLWEIGEGAPASYTVQSTTRFIAGLAFSFGVLEQLVLPRSLCSIGYQTPPCTYYYAGSAAEWESVVLVDEDLNGTYVGGENLYFYLDSEPQEAGNYWRYVAGFPKAW